jgi:hypothetical protein
VAIPGIRVTGAGRRITVEMEMTIKDEEICIKDAKEVIWAVGIYLLTHNRKLWFEYNGRKYIMEVKPYRSDGTQDT